MKTKILRLVILSATIVLTACASQVLQDGKQDFNAGNYQDSMQKLMPLAQKDNANAEYAVGYMYYYGKGVPVDRAQGIEWINKAAAQGLPEALQAQKMIENQAKMNPLKKSA